jgi:intracellular septation protein A
MAFAVVWFICSCIVVLIELIQDDDDECLVTKQQINHFALNVLLGPLTLVLKLASFIRMKVG